MNNVVPTFFAFFCAAVFATYSGSFAAFFILCVMLSFGFVLCRWGTRTPKETIFANKVFLFSFLIYAACAFFSVYFYRVSDGEFRLVVDQNSFFKWSQWAVDEHSIIGIIRDTYITRGGLWGDVALFRCATGIVAHIAETYFDGNKPEVLIAFVFGFSSYVPIFLFKVLSLRLRFEDALKYTLIYAAFSHLLYFSALIIRDVPVLFTYAVGFWFFFREFSIARLVAMCVLALCTFSLRPESGVLFFPFLLLYVWEKTKCYGGFRFPILLLWGCISVFLLLLSWRSIFASLSGYSQIAIDYAEYTEISNLEADGMSAYIARLPVGIREIARILNGFFPIVTAISIVRSFFTHGRSFPDIVHLSLSCVGHIFLTVLSLKCCVHAREIWNRLRSDGVLFSCMIGTLPLILGNSFSYSHRRVLFAYMFLYVLYLFSVKDVAFRKKL